MLLPLSPEQSAFSKPVGTGPGRKVWHGSAPYTVRTDKATVVVLRDAPEEFLTRLAAPSPGRQVLHLLARIQVIQANFPLKAAATLRCCRGG